MIFLLKSVIFGKSTAKKGTSDVIFRNFLSKLNIVKHRCSLPKTSHQLAKYEHMALILFSRHGDQVPRTSSKNFFQQIQLDTYQFEIVKE